MIPEITDTVDHAVDVCPECGAVMEHRGNMRTKDELDFQIIVKKDTSSFHQQLLSCLRI